MGGNKEVRHHPATFAAPLQVSAKHFSGQERTGLGRGREGEVPVGEELRDVGRSERGDDLRQDRFGDDERAGERRPRSKSPTLSPRPERPSLGSAREVVTPFQGCGVLCIRGPGAARSALHPRLSHPRLSAPSTNSSLRSIPPKTGKNPPLAVSPLALKHLGMEPVVGFEPTTDGLQNRCSTTELNWLGGCIPAGFL